MMKMRYVWELGTWLPITWWGWTISLTVTGLAVAFGVFTIVRDR